MKRLCLRYVENRQWKHDVSIICFLVNLTGVSFNHYQLAPAMNHCSEALYVRKSLLGPFHQVRHFAVRRHCGSPRPTRCLPRKDGSREVMTWSATLAVLNGHGSPKMVRKASFLGIELIHDGCLMICLGAIHWGFPKRIHELGIRSKWPAGIAHIMSLVLQKRSTSGEKKKYGSIDAVA